MNKSSNELLRLVRNCASNCQWTLLFQALDWLRVAKVPEIFKPASKWCRNIPINTGVSQSMGSLKLFNYWYSALLVSDFFKHPLFRNSSRVPTIDTFPVINALNGYAPSLCTPLYRFNWSRKSRSHPHFLNPPPPLLCPPPFCLMPTQPAQDRWSVTIFFTRSNAASSGTGATRGHSKSGIRALENAMRHNTLPSSSALQNCETASFAVNDTNETLQLRWQ